MIYFLSGLFLLLVFLNVRESERIARGREHDEYTDPYEGFGCKSSCLKCKPKLSKLEQVLE